MTRRLLPLLCVFAVGNVAAQAPRFDDATWQQLERLESAVPSPDGRLIAFTRVTFDTAASRHRATVWVMEDNGNNPREVGAGEHADWSPDSKRLAMVDGDAIRVATLDGSAPPLTIPVAPWHPGQVRWSPDGARLALSARNDEMGAARSSAAVSAGHGPGLRQSVLVARLDGTAPRAVTTADFLVGLPDPGLPNIRTFDWVDDRAVVVAGRFRNQGRAGETDLVVWRLDDSTSRVLPLGPGVWHAPVTSPNGRLIAYAGHARSEAGWTAEELWIVQPNGAAIRRLTPNIDRDVAEVAWEGDDDALWFATEDRGSRNLHRVTTKGDGITRSTTGVHLLSLGGIARRGGYGVAVRERPTAPPAVWRFPTGKPYELEPIFAPNDSLVASVDFGEVEEFEFRAADGTPVHAWLQRPPGFDPAVRYPMQVELHGGPHAMAGAGFAPARLRHAADGWLVLAVNPRGSTGFGGDFANAIARSWPGVDVGDVLAGVDDVIARGIADSSRMVLLGLGGGGVIAGSILTTTQRFAGATLRCTGAGWIALSGMLDRAPFGEWTGAKPLRLLPELWSDRSPVHRARDVRTSTLTIEGLPSGPRPVEFAEAFHLGVARTGTRAIFVRDADACGNDAVPGAALAHERAMWGHLLEGTP